MGRLKNAWILTVIILSLAACSRGLTKPGATSDRVTSKDSTAKPYLILISLDGFRWDYVNRFKPPYLSSFIKQGVKADALIPSFPSKTFPNHYTIATGMYPDNHGVLGNVYYNNEKKTIFNIRNRAMVEDGSYYGGTPIWVQAAKSGLITASYFFAGTEANIQGILPNYYFKYDGTVKNEVRVGQALSWLSLPEKSRPQFISLYFSDMDDTGHRYGPNADEELKKALFNLDEALGNLFKGVAATGLPVNIIIVSDHGMMEITNDRHLPLEMVENNDQYITISSGAIVHIHPKDSNREDAIFNHLVQQQQHYKVYKTSNTPGFEYIPKNSNWGTIQIVPDKGYYFAEARSIEAMKASGRNESGVHGYDPELKDMQGIFYANGPAFKTAVTVPALKNIHVFPLMCKLLGLPIPSGIDGVLNITADMLKQK